MQWVRARAPLLPESDEPHIRRQKRAGNSLANAAAILPKSSPLRNTEVYQYLYITLTGPIYQSATLSQQILMAILQPLVATITILFIAADPSQEQRIRLCTEMGNMLKAFGHCDTLTNTQFRLVLWPSFKLEDLPLLLRSKRPKIVHFSDHGSEDTVWLATDESGADQPRGKEVRLEIIAALTREVPSIGCLILKACHSAASRHILAKRVPTLITMQGRLEDPAAIAFSKIFYQMVGTGASIHSAYNLARPIAQATSDTLATCRPYAITISTEVAMNLIDLAAVHLPHSRTQLSRTELPSS